MIDGIPDTTPITVEMQMPHQDHLFDHIKRNAKYAKRMFATGPNTHVGRTVAICGAGPSLHEYLNHAPNPQPDQVWACNSAVPFLMENRARVTHAMGIDQGLGMLEDWSRVYSLLTYVIASSVHPQLVDHLRGHNVRLRWFHNYLGLPDPEGFMPKDVCVRCLRDKATHLDDHDYTPMSYEMSLYQTLFQPSCMPGFGLNVVSRAIGVALFMGFSKILVYGADCAAKVNSPLQPRPPHANEETYGVWTKQVVMYADGRTAFDVYGPKGPLMEATGGAFKGRVWHTRADMLVTARHPVQIVKDGQGRVELMGETLPGDLLHWTPEMWAAANAGAGVPDMTGKGGIQGFRLNTEEFIAETVAYGEMRPTVSQNA